MQELLRQTVDMMQWVAGNETERLGTGYYWIRHGARESMAVANYYMKYPGDLPSGASVAGVQFGALGHDIGKTICVSDPGIWSVRLTKITSGEWEEINAHVNATIHLFRSYQDAFGVVIPPEAFEYARYHHEMLDGSGLFHIPSSGLSQPARLGAVIDQIVSRCENREYRYGTPPMSLRQSFQDVNKDQGRLFDGDILRKVWDLYKENPYLDEPGYRWIFQNGHLSRLITNT